MSWSGKFNSSIYPKIMVNGTITVDNIDKPNIGTITYTGFYRKGKTSSGQISTSGNKMEINFNSLVTIKFTIINRNKTLIIGIYESTSPYDYGTFELYPS